MKARAAIYNLCLSIFLTFWCHAWAKSHVELGAELTATNSRLTSAYLTTTELEAELERILSQIESEVIKSCSYCQVDYDPGKPSRGLRVVIPGIKSANPSLNTPDIEINFFHDAPTIEVNISPLSEIEFRKNEHLLDQIIFESMAKAGLSPHLGHGGGHIHFDLFTLFGDDPLLFRNFVVDFLNHWDVFETFGAGPTYSPTIKMSKNLSQQDLVLFERELDRLFLGSRDRDPREIIRAQAEILDKFIYKEVKKNHALNIGLIPQALDGESALEWLHRTLEIRVFRAQNSIDEFIKTSKIITGRVEYLRQKQRNDSKFKVALNPLSVEYTSQETADRLHEYIRSGEQTLEDVWHAIYGDEEMGPVKDELLCQKILGV